MLKDLIEKLPNSDKPLTKVLLKNENTKVIAVGLKKGVVLNDHKAPGATKLIVVKGEVKYTTAHKEIMLRLFEEYDIPLDEIHRVEGLQDSLFLLLVNNQ